MASAHWKIIDSDSHQETNTPEQQRNLKDDYIEKVLKCQC